MCGMNDVNVNTVTSLHNVYPIKLCVCFTRPCVVLCLRDFALDHTVLFLTAALIIYGS